MAKQGKANQARPPWWMWALSGVAGCTIGLWLVPPTGGDRHALPRTEEAAPVGTTGRQVPASYETDPQPSIIREIETITGANDGMVLVGRRVDLHVDVQTCANDVAFWVGPRDNRVLVVLAPDNRSARWGKQSEPTGHRIVPVRGGQRAVITGVIRPVSTAEDLESWKLTDLDRSELDERKIYIRADAVASEGHGHF